VKLRTNPVFAQLAPSHQFNALVAAAEKESPSKAAQLREWNSTTQIALLSWLNDVVAQQPDPSREVERWRVRKGERELVCVAVYVPTGIDLRLMEAADFRRTQLVRDASEAEALCERWRAALMERGWGSCRNPPNSAATVIQRSRA
jgi:hypothetical protein